jgi:uncharacterized protein YdeI (YjbR/CyaY-like superfamily)
MSIDDSSYKIRFTPRRPGSNWSDVNIKKVHKMIDQGLMHPAGLKVFKSRKENKAALQSSDQRPDKLTEPYLRLLRKNKAARDYFNNLAPSYQRSIAGWILSAKKDETRLRRLNKFIEHSTRGELIPELAIGKNK